jgi:Transposase
LATSAEPAAPSASPHIDALADHVTAFAEMMANLTGSSALDTWLAAVEADDQPELRSLAAGIRNHKEAVINGLTLPYSSGRVEGTVNKIKTVKRQMYGRAGFTLLRKRVILHPAVTSTTEFAEEPLPASAINGQVGRDGLVFAEDRLDVPAVHPDLHRQQRGDQPGGLVPGMVREGHRLVRRTSWSAVTSGPRPTTTQPANSGPSGTAIAASMSAPVRMRWNRRRPRPMCAARLCTVKSG